MAFAFETVKGTYVEPTDDDTIFIPILDESLKYMENRYYSKQIRQQVMESDVAQGYYHVEGDINLEIDPENFANLMYCSRHSCAMTPGSPNEYAFVPSQAGATSTDLSLLHAKTCSITIVRNGIGFGYAGCTIGEIRAMVETADGIAKATLSILGESEQEPADIESVTPTWADANLFGADSHTVYTGDSAVSPTFVEKDGFDGFTFMANHAAEAQNRIKPQRSAAFVKYGETTITVDTTLDFDDRSDYNDFVATNQRAFKLESVKGGDGSWAGSPFGVRFQVNRGVFETYDIPLRGLGDIVTATVNAKGIGITGGDAYEIRVRTDKDLTALELS